MTINAELLQYLADNHGGQHYFNSIFDKICDNKLANEAEVEKAITDFVEEDV